MRRYPKESRVLRKIRRFIPIEQRILYYNAMIKQVMLYGSTIWSNCSADKGLCNNYLEGGWEMGEICPKTKSYPPLIKQKLISTPPHIMIILRLPPHPPLKKSPPIDSLIPSLLVGFLPPVQTSLQMTLRRTLRSHLKSHQNHWTLSLCRLRMNWEIPHLLQHLWH